MTDQTIPAGLTRAEAQAVREWAARARAAEVQDATVVHAARVLLAVLPRPTLADMTPEERAACRRMQCDVGGEDARAVIFNPNWEDGSARVLWPGGFFTYPGWERVTPRPDLPRLEWPGDTTAPAPVRVGDTIESADDPRIAALPTGSALLDCDGEAVAKRGELWVGDGYIPIPEEGGEFGPWTVLHISKEADQ